MLMRPNRLAIVRLPYEHVLEALQGLLRLVAADPEIKPEVVSVHDDFACRAFVLVLSHPSFLESKEGTPLPDISDQFSWRVVEDAMAEL